MTMFENLMRGADPELFLRDVNHFPVTSIGLIGGTKKDPRKIGNGYALQEDNVAVEFNIPPATNKAQFVASIQFVLGHLRQELEPKGLFLDISPTMEFSLQQLDHPQAQELGCEPDYNAWTMAQNPRPVAPHTFRSSGGHLHLGWDNARPNEALKMIKVHDLFCGCASLIYDDDNKRRDIYGKAGAMRIKDYGVEYRTLSNFWIKSEELTAWLYDQSEKAVQFLRDGKRIAQEDCQKVIDCINNSDHALLAELNEKYAII
jgi:hypothetical protein